MLSNKKYKGDALLQKTYTVDFLNKKRIENKGEVPQYYVEESHPAIIDKEVLEAVQLEKERRSRFIKEHGMYKSSYDTLDNPFSGRVVCGCCKGIYGRKVWNSTDERNRRYIWRCNKKYKVKGEKGCQNKHVEDKLLYETFINTFNTILENKEFFKEKWKENLKSENVLVRYKARQLIEIIENAKPLKEFNADIFFIIVERITIFEGKKIIIKLLDGTELEVII